MQLTEEQKLQVHQWASEGASLGEIQKRIEDEFGFRMTYMEARFLVSDLNVSLKDKEREPRKPEAHETPDQEETEEIGFEDEDLPGAPIASPGGGQVSVSLDEIAIPNAMVSGKVVFSDGERASWFVDPMGRLSLDTVTAGYRPSEQDIMDFQTELQNAVSGMM